MIFNCAHFCRFLACLDHDVHICILIARSHLKFDRFSSFNTSVLLVICCAHCPHYKHITMYVAGFPLLVRVSTFGFSTTCLVGASFIAHGQTESKSMKAHASSIQFSLEWFIIYLSTSMCSIVLKPLQNPACSLCCGECSVISILMLKIFEIDIF